MSKTYRNNDKERIFTNKSKLKKSNIKTTKEKKTNKSFDYLNSEFD